MHAQLLNPDETPLYFDHQATTPVDPAVRSAMEPHFGEIFGNPHSSEHAFGRRAYVAVETARAQIASLIGAEPEDIAFTSGATESNNLAILGLARNDQLVGRDTIIVSTIEHSSVLEAARHSGLRVVSIEVDSEGFVDADRLKACLNERVRLVSIGWVNNEIGAIQNVASLGSAVHEVGALVHVDAAQALSCLEMEVGQLPVDFVSLSSHKAYGPKGVGALYIAPGRAPLLRPLMYGGGQENGLRAGTLPTPLCVGFGSACGILRVHGDAERARIRNLRDHFLNLLRSVDASIRLVGPTNHRHPGNLSIRLPVADARDVIQLVHDHLACSSGSACHSGTELPSHVLLSIGLPVLEARKVLRLGIGRFTTEQDCERAAKILAAAITACRD